MKRDLASLTATEFDVLVIGGGIIGACVARDAALRGLRTALVERRDFAGGTSWNSLKVVHGGLRALQQLDVRRMREFIRERSTWLRIAPHLIDPLPVLVPTYGQAMQSRLLLRTALAVNDLVAWDRNRGVEPDRRLPAGRALSRQECIDLVPQLESRALTGAVMFYDGQMYSSERLVLEVLRSASKAGAILANYVEACIPLRYGGRVAGVRVRDELAGGELDVRARVVVNAAGSAAPALAARLTGEPPAAATDYSIALNLMIESLGQRVAFAFNTRSADGGGASGAPSRARKLLIVPWRGRTLIGTAHFSYRGDPAGFRPDERDVHRFLDEVNGAWPGEPFSRNDVLVVHGGLLPIAPGGGSATVRLLRQSEIVDHADDGTSGLISAVSVKFTTSRLVAERIVDLVCRKLRRRTRCRTAVTPLPGAPTSSVAELLAEAGHAHRGVLPQDTLDHLVRTYGTAYRSIIGYRTWLPGWNQRVVESAPVIRAQLVHGVREEMAQLEADLVERRTELGARGVATEVAQAAAAEALGVQRAADNVCV